MATCDAPEQIESIHMFTELNISANIFKKRYSFTTRVPL